VGTLSLDPNGTMAMDGQRHPITEIGMLNLCRRLVKGSEDDMKHTESEVKYFSGAKVNDRASTCIQIVHPVPRSNFRCHLMRFFVDDQWNVPIRFEAHDWPKQPGAAPELLEEYTYVNLKFNNGFTDKEFDIANPNYHFR
jgi:hypothetical protein